MALNSVRMETGRSSNVTLVIRSTNSDTARDSAPTLHKNTTGDVGPTGLVRQCICDQLRFRLDDDLVCEDQNARILCKGFSRQRAGGTQLRLHILPFQQCRDRLAVPARSRQQYDPIFPP